MAPVTRPKLLASGLLPKLFERMEANGRLNVLDAGSGSQSTIDFFGRYKARIHFLNLLSNDCFTHPPENAGAESVRASVSRNLVIPDGVTFDLCFFWDVLHRLKPAVLQGLSCALDPHFGEHTLGYGLTTLHGLAPESYRYGVVDESHVIIRPVSGEASIPTCKQQQLSNFFTSLVIQRSTLLQEGRVEMLFGRD